MLCQDIFDLIWPYPEAAGFYYIVKPAVEPVKTVFVHISRVSRMVNATAPYMIVLLLVIKVSAEHSGLFAVFGRYYNYLAYRSLRHRLAVLSAQLDIVKRRGYSH